jgi:hypothetical protein
MELKEKEKQYMFSTSLLMQQSIIIVVCLNKNLEFHLLIFKLSRETADKASKSDILLN